MPVFLGRVTRLMEQRCSMVQFLRRLLAMFRGSVRKSPHQDDVAASEQIARYILSKRYFSTKNRTVKYGAYLPAPDGETSVYRISGLSEEEIWEIGQEYVAKPSRRTLLRAGGYSSHWLLTRMLCCPLRSPFKASNRLPGGTRRSCRRRARCR